MQTNTLKKALAFLIVLLCMITILIVVFSSEAAPIQAAQAIAPEASSPSQEPSQEPSPMPTPEPSYEPSPTPIPEPPKPQPITAADWYGVAPEDLQDRLKGLYVPTVAEVDRITRTMGNTKLCIGEYIGYDPVQIAAVPWCICNRYDAGFGEDFTHIITRGVFHAYSPNTPIDQRLQNYAIDVITRWLNEKLGFEDVGRVLPAEYLYFSGTGKVNVYRTTWRSSDPSCKKWNWSLPSPYET